MISDVAILTRDRPAALSRVLEHFMLHARSLDRPLRWHVFDDARDASEVQANCSAVEHARGAFGVGISHVTRADRLRWVDALVREGAGTVHPDVARSAVMGPDEEQTIGATRNAITLSLAGRQVLSVDDDVIPSVAPMIGHRAGIRFEPSRDPTEFHFFPAREQAVDALSPCALSLVEAHEVLLGRSIELPTSAEHARPRKGRVAITMAGLAGDSGMGGMLYYALLEGGSRARWVADYHVTRTTREVVRGATTATVSGALLLVGANLALDTDAWLPPFAPVGRNEEGPAAVALRTSAPDCYIGHVPYVVVHAPVATRIATFEQGIAAVQSPLSSHLLMLCMGAMPRHEHQTDPAARAARLGRFLVGLGADPIALHRLVRAEAIRAQEVRLTRLEDALASRTSEPDAWVEDLRQLLRAGESAMAHGDYPVAGDLEGDPAHRGATFRDRLVSYGRILTQWPALRAAARALEEKGRGLGAP